MELPDRSAWRLVASETGETEAACERRELAEETGYEPGKRPLQHIGRYIFDPSSSTTEYYLYLARDARAAGPQRLDATEEIAVELVTFADLRRYVRDGTIRVGVHIAAIYTVLDYLERLDASSAPALRT